MNLGQIRRAIRESVQSRFSLDKMSVDKKFSLEDTTIDLAINQGYRLFSAVAGLNKQVQRAYTSADVRDVTIPAEILTLDVIGYLSGVRVRRLLPIERDKLLIYESLTGNPVSYSYEEENNLRLYPAPKYDGDQVLFFGSFPFAELIADGDIPKIPGQYHPALVKYGMGVIHQWLGLLDDNQAKLVNNVPQFEADFRGAAKVCKNDTAFSGDEDFRFGQDVAAYSMYEKLKAVYYQNPIFTHIYFDTNSKVVFYSKKRALNLFAVGPNRMEVWDAMFLGADQVQVTTDNFIYNFKGKINSIYALKVRVVRGLEGRKAETHAVYIVSQFPDAEADSSIYMLTPIATNVPDIISLNINPGTTDDVELTVINGKNAVMTLEARFLGTMI